MYTHGPYKRVKLYQKYHKIILDHDLLLSYVPWQQQGEDPEQRGGHSGRGGAWDVEQPAGLPLLLHLGLGRAGQRLAVPIPLLQEWGR